MAKKSKIVTEINNALANGKLKQPFNVNEVNIACNGILAKSPSFLSKHREKNPGNYTVYFSQNKDGKYSII
ncbi:hypothetical protein [Flavobacterium sp.]|uniref:hypothetical protein n=1 Tax=Flavobacterium sp. TaxID=239 RepID=UPI004048A0B9